MTRGRWMALVVVAAWPSGSNAQAPRPTVLGAAVARAREPLSLVTQVRELRSGEVVVADPIERKVFVLPASLASMRALGREGGGPGEYRQPDAVWPWPGDSTLVVDLGNARLSIVGPGGTWGRSIPMAGGAEGGPPAVIFPGGVDRTGRIHFAPPAGGGPMNDSAQVMRTDGRGGRAEPVARYKTPDVDRQESGSARQREVRIRPIPLAAADGWAVAVDGAVALVRREPYRVDWVRDGVLRTGPVQMVARARLTDADKREWVGQQMLSGGISMSVEEENGRRSMSFGRSRPTSEPDISGYKWPDRKPVFDPASVRVDPTGRAWVRRYGAPGEPRTHDVFDGTGRLVGQVTLPARRVLLGFGAAALYAAEVDEDGQYTLERYRLPL